MSDIDEIEFNLLLQVVGNLFDEHQINGVAQVFGLPFGEYNTGKELLKSLYDLKKIGPDDLSVLLLGLECNHVAIAARELVQGYIEKRANTSSRGGGGNEGQTPSANITTVSTADVSRQAAEGRNIGEGQRQSVLSNNTPTVDTFIEREDIAEKLEKRVRHPLKNEATRYFALVGEGGAGKTQMSLWFCDQMLRSDLYEVIWFMSGDGLESFTADLEDLMEELDIEYQGIPPKKLKRLLSQELNRRGRWLLVVDNFEGMALKDLKEWIPERGGTVLLTTRDSDVAIPNDNFVKMLPFSDDETSNLFEKILGKGIVSSSDLKKIGERFGHNAFALSVCAYYLRELHVPAGERTLDIIKDSLKKIIEESVDKETNETITTMYERSLRVVVGKSPESWRMMKKLSLLSAEGVSREVVRKILKGKVLHEEKEKTEMKEIEELLVSGKVLEAQERILRNSVDSDDVRIQPKDSCEEYVRKELELMKKVLNLGLAEKRGDKYYVHRLMMHIVRERMNHTGEFTSVLEEVIGDMDKIWIEDSRDHTLWKKKQEMGEHVVSLAIHEEHLSSTLSRELLVNMLRDYSFYTIEVKGDYTAAEERIAKAEQVEGGGKCSKVVRAALKSVRGRLRASQGKYTEAIAEYREALEMEEEESRKASDYNNIGLCLFELKYPEALEEYEKSLEIDMKYKGGNSIEVGRTLNNMGICLTRMGSYEEALEKHGRALEICMDKYGEVNPLVATSYNNIGACYTDMEKYEDALEMHEKALEVYRQVHGEGVDHPEVARSLHNVGLDKRRLGRVEEAKPLLEEAYRIRRLMLGEDHPDTIKTKEILDTCRSLSASLRI